jgi:hypothetical protein
MANDPDPLPIASDEPLPRRPEDLAAEIRALAAARTKAAANHRYWCMCTVCKLRRRKERVANAA